MTGKKLHATILRVWPVRYRSPASTCAWKVWNHHDLADVNAVRQEGPAIIKVSGEQVWSPLIYGMK